MVTVLDVAPPMPITTGIEAPFDDAAGTNAFTWYSPRPENSTVAGAPLLRDLAAVCGRSAGGWQVEEWPTGGSAADQGVRPTD
jgi:hypothetical protein